jgi:hypothetical protein
VTAYSLGVALRRALARRLGIEEREIGSIVTPGRNADGQPVSSIHLFDTAQGGAGYVTQALYQLPELFRGVRQVLECPRGCDSACQACLLTYETQYHLELLDRILALSLLNDRYLNAFELPASLQAFGSASRLEMEPLAIALHRELQRFDVKEVRLYLNGRTENWEPLDWRLRDNLLRLRSTGCNVKMIIPEKLLEELLPSQRDELAALAALTGAEIFSCDINPIVVEGTEKIFKIMEIGGARESIRWASTSLEAAALNPERGSGISDAQFVMGRFNDPLQAIERTWSPKASVDIRKPEGNLFSISMKSDLDGPIRSFGSRAWEHIFNFVPELKKRLKSSQPISAVEYSDRYLRSPLVLMLLRELLVPLSEYPGGISSESRILIRTSKLLRNDTRDPRFIYHDWRDASDRRQMFEAILNIKVIPDLREERKENLPHARELRLSWQDGTIWKLRLDQGMGYWRTVRSNESFPFDQSVDRQVKHLEKLDIDIHAGNHDYPTFWYIGINGQD